MATQSRLLQYTDKICRDDSGIIQNGDKLFPKMILRFNNGLLHGEGEPAAEYLDGHHEWWKNGKLHRDDGPAVYTIVEDEDGNTYEEWWKEGEHLLSL